MFTDVGAAKDEQSNKPTGYFTIVDGNKVTARDCGTNFFVTQDDIGESRAKVVTKWMAEMNPDVNGIADERVKKKRLLSFFTPPVYVARLWRGYGEDAQHSMAVRHLTYIPFHRIPQK